MSIDEVAQGWDRELRVGEYRGFRAWTMKGPWSPLRSLSWSFDWRDGVNQAQCLATRSWRTDEAAAARCQATHPESPVHLTTCLKTPYHTKPTAGCGCGFWAYFDRDYWLRSESRVQVYGIIRGWGTCRVGAKGFRAEFAQIEALAIANRAESVAIDSGGWLGGFSVWDDESNVQQVLTNLMQRHADAEVYPSVQMMLDRHNITEGKHGE